MTEAEKSIGAAFQQGVEHHRAGRFSQAEALYRQVLAIDPTHSDSLNLLGVLFHQLGKNDTAIEFLGKAIAAQPSVAQYHFNLGNAFRDSGYSLEAEGSFRTASRLKPDYLEALNNLGNLLLSRGKHDEAEKIYRAAVRFKPDSAESHNNLGNVLRIIGRLDEATACCAAALRLRPNYPEARYNLGCVLEKRGDVQGAVENYRAALQNRPDHIEAHIALADILRLSSRFSEAEEHYRAALLVKSDIPNAHYNLGVVLQNLGRSSQAEAAYRVALQLNPDHAEVHNNLGVVLQHGGRLEESEACYRSALRIKPDLAETLCNLGGVVHELGRLDEAVTCLRAALKLKPDLPVAHSNLIFMLELVPGLSHAALQDERHRWYEQHGKRFASTIEPHQNVPDPGRKLRLGYVSADFRYQSAASAFGPILRHHDHNLFDVIYYSNVSRGEEDQMTLEFREIADEWRDIRDMDDDAVATQIRADRIDILIDCSGHNSGNRLPVFARKPAPVQIAGWGHAERTLMPVMDYLFGDPVSLPEDARAFLDESIIDLPCWVVYEAPEFAPPVAPLPERAGGVTFGCLNRVSKLSETTLDLWGRLLASMPEARLLLKAQSLDQASVQARLRKAFSARSIDPERLILLGGTSMAEHMGACDRIDIALDPFPDSGGISTLETLWMGVPIVTLPGNTGASRGTAAILSALGLHDWIAADADDYVRIAATRAGDRETLARLRKELRPRLASSSIGDAPSYTRLVEAAYRNAWQKWCKKALMQSNNPAKVAG